MTLDINRVIGAVERRSFVREHEGRPARVVVATRVYDTGIDDLWDALTNEERIPRWFLPISGELRPGGHYQLEGNAGGEIEECDPPRHLMVTWVMQGPESWVTVDLSEADAGGTLLRLEHMAHVPDDFWEQFGPGAVGVGWDQALLGLDQHLATESAVSPDSAMEWLQSEEGRRFVKESSDAWREAAIADGADADAARAAAERTRAFYTGDGGGSEES